MTVVLLTCSNIFLTFAWLYMKEKPSLDYLWAGLCLLGAAWFVFRRHLTGT